MDFNERNVQDAYGENQASPTLGGKIYGAAKGGLDKMKDNAKKGIQAIWKKLPLKAKIIVIAVVIGIFMTLILLFAAAAFILSIEESSRKSGAEEYRATAALAELPTTNVTSEEMKLTYEQAKEFIKNYNSENVYLKQALLDRLDPSIPEYVEEDDESGVWATIKNLFKEKEHVNYTIMEWQENYGYSAALLITIAFQELDNETVDVRDQESIAEFIEKVNDFFDKMDEKGKKWKEKGYTGINDIAIDYAGKRLANEWANNVLNNMTDTAIDTGVVQPVEEEPGASGNGYIGTYKNKSGRTFRNYKQNEGSYANSKWCGDSIVRNDGCSLIAVTIVLSGYRNSEIDPLALANQYAVRGMGMNIDGALSGNNLSYTRFPDSNSTNVEFSTQQKQQIKDHLKTGGVAIIKVVPPSTFTDSTHFMTLLDYNEAEDTIYLSNPYHGGNRYGETGFLAADKVLKGCVRCYYIH